ncbi:endonuclease/exonuclease/phosphatase family protein [Lichenicola sp.]|uniref:endonuclease/exonuclease/phosphatase family protein n=1 Tax=Lichenicola sp. TaxID=2804529 RepID=UPI003B00666B
MTRARAAIARLLVGLGLAWPMAVQAAGPDDVKIATWNMEWLTSRPAGDPSLPEDALPKRDVDVATLAGYALQLDASVVALEEVDDPALVARIFPPDRYRVLFTGDHVVQRVALAVRQGVGVTQNPDLQALDVALPGQFHLRSGLDATLTFGATTLRVLAVHLKSGCWEGVLPDPKRHACAALAEQLPVLQDWIAARRSEGVAFLVLGDFNRRLKADDVFLAGLRRDEPLASATAGHASPCWGGEDFIDQVLAGGPAQSWMEPDSLRVLVYRETDPAMKERISDHCPVSVRFRIPAG